MTFFEKLGLWLYGDLTKKEFKLTKKDRIFWNNSIQPIINKYNIKNKNKEPEPLQGFINSLEDLPPNKNINNIKFEPDNKMDIINKTRKINNEK